MKLTKSRNDIHFHDEENPEIAYKGKRVKHASITLEDLFDCNKNLNPSEKNEEIAPSKNPNQSQFNDFLLYFSIEFDKLYIEYIDIVSYFNSIYLKWQKDLNDNHTTPSLIPNSEFSENNVPLSTIDSIISDSIHREREIEIPFSNIHRQIEEISKLISQSNNSHCKSNNYLIKQQHNKSLSDLYATTKQKTSPQTASYAKYANFNREHKAAGVNCSKKTKDIHISHLSINI